MVEYLHCIGVLNTFFISEMSSVKDLITALDAIELEMEGHRKCLNESFANFDEEVKTWNSKRKDILKLETRRVLKAHSEIDRASFEIEFCCLNRSMHK